MATYTPPPYFPQNTLSPASEGRYKKFKLAVFAVIILLLLALGGGIIGLIYLLKWMF